MKLQHILGAMCLAGLGNLAIISTGFAAATPVQIAKPSRSAITTAIAEVKQIGDYQTLFATSAHPLDSTTEFYQEYNYLLGLVTTAENLLADYDQASAKDLNMIIAAADDAKIACNLLFGTARQAKTVAHADTRSQATVAKATTKATTTSTPTTSAQSSAKATQPAAPATKAAVKDAETNT